MTDGGLLCFRPDGYGSASCMVVPPQLVGAVLQFVHKSSVNGHYGLRRTEARVRGRYWWLSWKKDISMKMALCVACNRGKKRRGPEEVRQ